MLKIFLRRVLAIATLIFVVFMIFAIETNTNEYRANRTLSDLLISSVFGTLYLGILPIILSSLLTPLFKETWKISNTPLKRDVVFIVLILILTPLSVFVYYHAGMLAA